MQDKDKKFGRFPKIAQELAGRQLKSPGVGGAIGRTLRSYASGMVETAKLPGEVLKGKKYSTDEAVNFATSMVAMPGRGGGFGSGARFKIVPKPKNTTDAIGIGLNMSAPQLAKARNTRVLLEQKTASIMDKVRKSRSPADFDALSKVATTGQMYREAIEAATNTGSMKYYLESLKPEQIAELKAKGRKLAPKNKDNVTDLITKPVRDFSKNLNNTISKRVAEKVARIKEASSEYKFDTGDRIKSVKTGKVFEVKFRNMNKDGRATYRLKGSFEEGNHYADLVHENFIHLTGPKKKQ